MHKKEGPTWPMSHMGWAKLFWLFLGFYFFSLVQPKALGYRADLLGWTKIDTSTI